MEGHFARRLITVELAARVGSGGEIGTARILRTRRGQLAGVGAIAVALVVVAAPPARAPVPEAARGIVVTILMIRGLARSLIRCLPAGATVLSRSRTAQEACAGVIETGGRRAITGVDAIPVAFVIRAAAEAFIRDCIVPAVRDAVSSRVVRDVARCGVAVQRLARIG